MNEEIESANRLLIRIAMNVDHIDIYGEKGIHVPEKIFQMAIDEGIIDHVGQVPYWSGFRLIKTIAVSNFMSAKSIKRKYAM